MRIRYQAAGSRFPKDKFGRKQKSLNINCLAPNTRIFQLMRLTQTIIDLQNKTTGNSSWKHSLIKAEFPRSFVRFSSSSYDYFSWFPVH